jgi:hypothetical protein
VIIRHEVGVPGLKKVLILLLFLLPASLMCLSCGGGASSTQKTSGVAYRAFITNNVSAGTLSPGIYVVDAENDVRATASVIPAGNTPGMMVLTPNRAQTLVFSGSGTQSSDNQFTIIDNAKESSAGQVTLLGMTESFVVSPDSSTAYVAVPTAPVTGQSPGVVEVIALSSGITASISCPPGNPTPSVCVSTDSNLQGVNAPYRYLSIGNTGTRVLAFSQGSGQNFDSVPNVVAVITPSSVGTANPVVTFVPGFDHPVWAYFNSDDTTAYVMNCGPECGGIQASIQTLDLTTNTAGPAFSVPAATVALVNNSTMYLAGTPASQSCTGETTQATTCGLLTIFDLNTMRIVQPPVQPPYCPTGEQCPIIITDGYHDRMALGANGQLFVGARTCTEVVAPIPPPTGAEVRGCLSIYNTLTTAVGNVPAGAVVIPPANGDVTGIQPIATRGVVYLIQGQSVQGGSLYIYDTTIDALEYNPNDPNNPGQISNLIGNFVDVKTVDF